MSSSRTIEQVRHHPQHAHPPDWISAESTRLKLDWTRRGAFVLARTRPSADPVIERLLREHLADASITLG